MIAAPRKRRRRTRLPRRSRCPWGKSAGALRGTLDHSLRSARRPPLPETARHAASAARPRCVVVNRVHPKTASIDRISSTGGIVETRICFQEDLGVFKRIWVSAATIWTGSGSAPSSCSLPTTSACTT